MVTNANSTQKYTTQYNTIKKYKQVTVQNVKRCSVIYYDNCNNDEIACRKNLEMLSN